MTRGQVLQPSCCNRFGLEQGFYFTTELSQGQGISCRDREFLCCDRVSWNGVAIEYFMSRQSLVKIKGFFVMT